MDKVQSILGSALQEITKPILFNDLVRILRDDGWRGESGAHFMSRTYGAGLAVYVCSKPFVSVKTPRGTYPVRAY